MFDKVPQIYNFCCRIVQEKAQFVEDNYLGLLRAYEHEIGEEILPAVPSDLIHKIYGIIHANSVEINIEEVSAQAIYSASNYIEHNCISCTSDQVDVQNQFQITFRYYNQQVYLSLFVNL